MRIEVIGILLVLFFTPYTAFAQGLQTVVSVDSRVGYTSNTYLNPFFSEWDESVETGYGLASVFSQSFWSDNTNSIDATLGLVAEPFFGNDSFWRGGLGVLDYRRRFNNSFSGGAEAGGSYFSSNFTRSMFWFQPYATWFASPFTSVTAKIGINKRSYKNFSQDIDTDTRFDYYGLQAESWFGYNWQLKAGLFSSLENFPSLDQQFSSTLSLSYLFLNGVRITASGGYQQFGFEQIIETGGGPGGGGPPFGGGGEAPAETEISQEYDRIYKMGLTGDLPINQRFSIYASVEGLHRNISNSQETFNDIQLSAGVRISMRPNIISRSGKKMIDPEWRKSEDRNMMLNINYNGGGRLYLVGDFNNWNRAGIPITQTSGKTYSVEIPLESGAYEYKILHVEGNTEEWLEFSSDTYTVDDGFGGENGMILVE